MGRLKEPRVGVALLGLSILLFFFVMVVVVTSGKDDYPSPEEASAAAIFDQCDVEGEVIYSEPYQMEVGDVPSLAPDWYVAIEGDDGWVSSAAGSELDHGEYEIETVECDAFDMNAPVDFNPDDEYDENGVYTGPVDY